MKKNTMATAIVAGLAGVAGIANISTAVNLNPDGVGQVLLYPYYTVNDGNTTALSVVNTTDSGKAVKVRFLDAVTPAKCSTSICTCPSMTCGPPVSSRALLTAPRTS